MRSSALSSHSAKSQSVSRPNRGRQSADFEPGDYEQQDVPVHGNSRIPAFNGDAYVNRPFGV